MNVLETAETLTPKFKKGDLVLVIGKGFSNYAYGHMAVVVRNGRRPDKEGDYAGVIPVDVVCRREDDDRFLQQSVPETELRLVTESELFTL